MNKLNSIFNSTTVAICFLLSTTTLISQNESRFDFGVSGGLMATYSVFDTDLANRTESSAAYNFAIDLFYDITDDDQIKTGLSYENYSFDVLDFSPRFPSDLIGGIDIDIFNSFRTGMVEASFLIVPAELRYKIFGNVNHLYLTGGLAFKFLLEDKSINNITSGDDTFSSPFLLVKNFVIDLRFSIGYEFKLGSMKYYIATKSFVGLNELEKFDGSAVADSRLYGIGLFSGLRF
jgi:hypothetical protein